MCGSLCPCLCVHVCSCSRASRLQFNRASKLHFLPAFGFIEGNINSFIIKKSSLCHATFSSYVFSPLVENQAYAMSTILKENRATPCSDGHCVFLLAVLLVVAHKMVQGTPSHHLFSQQHVLCFFPTASGHVLSLESVASLSPSVYLIKAHTF